MTDTIASLRASINRLRRAAGSGGGSSGGGGSVAWADVTGKPSTFPPSGHTHPAAEVTGTKTSSFISDFAAAVAALITGKADTVHAHTASQVSDFAEAVDDRISTLLVAGSNVSLTYDDVANTLTIAVSGAGGGGSSPALAWVI